MLDDLMISATKYTPEVEMQSKGFICIAGKSYPENTFEFYKPVMAWLMAFVEADHSNKTVRVRFEIDYFNSSTSSLLYDFFELLQKIEPLENVQVQWFYRDGDESIQEAGEDFQEDFPELRIELCAK